jgi:hypothetical protein
MEDFDAKNRIRDLHRDGEQYRLARLAQDGAKANRSFSVFARFGHWIRTFDFRQKKSISMQ